MRTLAVSTAVAAGLLLASPQTRADFAISNAILYFESGKADRQDIEVENTGAETLYLSVTPYAVRHPGTPQEQREKIEDPAASGLLVTPNKLALPPNTRKLLRFTNLLADRAEEGVYRVEIAPVSGKLIAEQTGVKLQVGYEVLVLMQPAQVNADLTSKRQGDRLELTNTGNTNVYLRDGRNCPAQDFSDSRCVALEDKRIYPGGTHAVTLRHGGGAQYQVGVGTKYTLRQFP